MSKARAFLMSFALCALPALGGCSGLKWLVYVFTPEQPDPVVEAEYAGLEGRSVAIVVYADAGTLFEYPRARLEVASAIANEMRANVKNVRVVDPQRVIRWQNENLDWDNTDRTKMGQLFGANYVLYVALARFTTREPGSEYLFRGDIQADIFLYQTSLDERRSRVWAANDVRVQYPPTTAVPADNDNLVRLATISVMADYVAKKFYKHKVPRQQEPTGTGT
ncbi:MAG: hypothetical protein ACE15C_17030 [Phycisphaerae bacterium]